jgi:hypothetical protein
MPADDDRRRALDVLVQTLRDESARDVDRAHVAGQLIREHVSDDVSAEARALLLEFLDDPDETDVRLVAANVLLTRADPDLRALRQVRDEVSGLRGDLKTLFRLVAQASVAVNEGEARWP